MVRQIVDDDGYEEKLLAKEEKEAIRYLSVTWEK